MRSVLNVIGSLDIGGAEINAMNILRNMERGKYNYEFIIFDEKIGAFEKEAIQLGATIIRMQEPKSDYKVFLKAFNNLLKEKHYEAIHVNTLWNSGLLLKIAKKHNIPIRICHSHSTESSANEHIVYKGYKLVMRQLILRATTDFIACGVDAGNYLYGANKFKQQGKVIYNGVNIERFRYNSDIRQQVRKELGISSDTVVLGHVGRLAPVKNHTFMLALLEEVVKDYRQVKMIFVGDGPDYEKIRKEISERKLQDHIILLGSRTDVNRLLQSFDILLFPSIFEGFPVTLVEAQASGLPCLISSSITDEARLTDQCHLIPLADKKKWFDTITRYISAPTERKNVDISIIEKEFNSHYIAKIWEDIYDCNN